MKTKALVVLSGGQDSVTCLGWALKNYNEVAAISFTYGQKHSVELECALEVCDKHAIPIEIVQLHFLSNVVNSNLFEGEDDVCLPHPDQEHLPSSFVPNRNALFLTVAHGFAQKIKAETLVTGVCQTDYSGYPDCRDEFIQLLSNSLNLGAETSIEIQAPLMFLTKAETFSLAKEVGFLDDVIELSHTCYNGDHDTRHAWGYGCGHCPACEVRAKGWYNYKKSLVREDNNSDFMGARLKFEKEAHDWLTLLGKNNITPILLEEFVKVNQKLIGEL